MDILERVAKAIEDLATGLNLRTEGFKCEIEESTADIKESHFVLDWKPGLIEERNGGDALRPYHDLFNPEDQAFLMAFPVTLKFTSQSSGQAWRMDMVRYTTEFNMLFWRPHNVGGLGLEQSFFFEFTRDPDSDVKEKIEDGNLDSGFLMEQHWTGHVIMSTKRNNTEVS